MNIATIGAGYVGLVTSACLAELGHRVVAVERDPRKLLLLRRNEPPFFEPGLGELCSRNVAAGKLFFTADIAEACIRADVVFIAVGTPPRPGDGHADLRQVHQAARQIAAASPHGAIIVTKSTVPVGTGDEIERILVAAAPEKRWHVASSPEFLREGSAISDFLKAERVVIGADDEKAAATLATLFAPLAANGTRIVTTSRRSAELTKYACNAFLATKIAFINEIADLCEAVGADVTDVAAIMGLDSRIGAKFLNAGPGFGGSCFPKDTLALLKTAHDMATPLRIVETLVSVNEQRRRAMARKVVRMLGGSARGKTVAVLGLTFKPDTDDMREAPSISIITALEDAGATIRAYDPEGMANARLIMPDVTYCEDAWSCLEQADVAVLITEWKEFASLSPARMSATMRRPVLVDLRNLFDPARMAAAGISYEGIGRGMAGTVNGGEAAVSRERAGLAKAAAFQ